jgi:phage terminase large subunit-like protein
MMDWSTACPDWSRRILAGESLIPFAPLFPAEAESALAVFKELHVNDVQNAPTMGDIARPWILDLAGHIFGCYNAETGRRLITEFFLLIAKKKFEVNNGGGDHDDRAYSELARVRRVFNFKPHNRNRE